MSARATVVALARVEGRRLLRHPAVLAAAALPVAMALLFLLFADKAVEDDYTWSLIVPFMALAAATLVAVNLAALRARRDGAEELYGSCPASARALTAGHLASLAWAVVAAAFLVAIVVAAFMSKGGPLASIFLALMAPSIVLVCGALGLTLARWLPHPAAALIGVVGLLTVLGNIGADEPSGWRLPVLGLLALAFLFGTLGLIRDRSQLA